MKKNKDIKENQIDVKNTIVGFIAPEEPEKTQEQEIIDFKLKRDREQVEEEEKKEEKKLSYEEEEERLKKIKQELLQSLNVRIPAIEKRFKMQEPTLKKQKIKGLEENTIAIEKGQQENITIKEKYDEKERE